MIVSGLFDLLIMSSISCCVFYAFVLMYDIGIKFDMIDMMIASPGTKDERGMFFQCLNPTKSDYLHHDLGPQSQIFIFGPNCKIS